MKSEQIIIIIVAIVVVVAVVIGILVAVKKRGKTFKDQQKETDYSLKMTHAELIDKSREQVERNYKTCLALYNLYKARLSAELRKTFEEILPILQYCSPSDKEVVAKYDQDILNNLETLKGEFSKAESQEKELEKILFAIKTVLADRSVEV